MKGYFLLLLLINLIVKIYGIGSDVVINDGELVDYGSEPSVTVTTISNTKKRGLINNKLLKISTDGRNSNTNALSMLMALFHAHLIKRKMAIAHSVCFCMI